MKKVYVSFPIAGYDIEEREKYDEEVKKIVQEKFPDYEILTPFVICPYDENRSHADCMKECIINVYDCEIFIVCPDWLSSKGCRDEYYTAVNYGLDIYDLTKTETIEKESIGSIEVNLLKVGARALEIQQQKVN